MDEKRKPDFSQQRNNTNSVLSVFKKECASIKNPSHFA